MSIEDAKKELREYRDNIKYIEEKQNDAEDVRSKVEKITSILSETMDMDNKLMVEYGFVLLII